MLSLFYKDIVRAVSLAGILATSWPVIADDDFVIVLDQSKSMLEKSPDRPEDGYEVDPRRAPKSQGAIEAIIHMVTDVLEIGDYLAVITFGNRAEVAISQAITHEKEREVIQKRIEDLSFQDRKTDIVAGIEEAGKLIDSLKTPERRKILVLITDGNNDPPRDSPYARSEQQQNVYSSLRENIQKKKWNFTVVGFGKRTDTSRIINQLDLPPEAALSLDAQESGDIRKRLTAHFKSLYRAQVKLTPAHISLRLEPNLFGGYSPYEAKMTLFSSFTEPVDLQLLESDPVAIEVEYVRAVVSSTRLHLGSDQKQDITLTIAFDGKRPKDGEVTGTFAFQFDKGSKQFYPHTGPIKIVLLSWWETHGLFAIAAALIMVILVGITRWVIRRAQVAELRVLVTASDKPLGEPMTLRRKDAFTIGNNIFSGRTVAARGLSCAIAATVKYLGRRKFEISPGETTLIQSGKKHNRLTVLLDVPFDLQDREGKSLRDITISKHSQSSTDPFGAGAGTGDF